MYRIFCESFNNYIKEFEQTGAVDEYRYLIALPLKLITDLELYKTEQAKLVNMILNLAYWDNSIAETFNPFHT